MKHCTPLSRYNHQFNYRKNSGAKLAWDIFNKLKESIWNTIDPITHIFNLSFESVIVFGKMKLTKVIPIFKSGNKNLFNNYRPISFFPAYSNLLGKKAISFFRN